MEKRGRTGAWLLLPVILLCFSLAVTRLERDAVAEGRQLLEDAVRRSAVACYASEGFYPADIGYLQRHYGLQYDESRYVVHYEMFASNLMPDITVLEKEYEK